MIEAASGAVLLALASLIAGPWSLVVLLPAAIDAVGRWLGADGLDRAASVWWGVVVAVALIALPEPALIWWPWPWQINRATLWGLLWPHRHPQWIAAACVLRVVLIVAVARAKDAAWYLVQRLRREIIVPTASGAAYNAADLHDVQIPGVANPHRAPGAEPAAPLETVRAFRVENVPADPPEARALARDGETGDVTVAAGGSNGGNHRRIVEIPVDLLGDDEHDALRRVQAVAYGVLEDGRPWSRPEWTGSGGVFGPAEWRRLNRWLVERGLVYKVGPARNDPHEFSRGGRAWLAAFLDGD
jgi:hypothetical protein